MAGMGPPPKHPDARRRTNATVAMTALPAGGRQGEAPTWPLGLVLDGEWALWQQLWTTPQATAWERLGPGTVRVVARYTRLLAEAEQPAAGARAASMAAAQRLTEVRQLEDRLGLTPMAMLRLRWEIAADEVAEARAERTAPPRRRFRAVDPGAAAGG